MRDKHLTALTASTLLALFALAACDEREIGVPLSRLEGADVVTVEVRGIFCNTISTREGRDRVAGILSRYPEWPLVPECRTTFCNDVVARWKVGEVIVAEVGVCGERVTVHIPGPQGCGRTAPVEQARALLAAFGVPPPAAGSAGAPPNERMHLTKPAQAMELRR